MNKYYIAYSYQYIAWCIYQSLTDVTSEVIYIGESKADCENEAKYLI